MRLFGMVIMTTLLMIPYSLYSLFHTRHKEHVDFGVQISDHDDYYGRIGILSKLVGVLALAGIGCIAVLMWM